MYMSTTQFINDSVKRVIKIAQHYYDWDLFMPKHKNVSNRQKNEKYCSMKQRPQESLY